MQFSGFEINGKKVANLAVGCMRFPNGDIAKDIINRCEKDGALYLDTAPGYCYQNDEVNTEVWSGAAVKENREKYIISAKCSPGSGGVEIGEFNKPVGVSVTTEKQVREVIDQTLRRMDLPKIDCYQMWAVHSMKIYNEGIKKGGWYDGVLKAKDEGLFDHIGITGHSTADEFIEMLESGRFEMVTFPFHILDSQRLKLIDYCLSKNILPIAMNPLAGGFLCHAESDKVNEFLAKYGMESMSDMAISFVNAFGAVALSGMTSVLDAEKNIKSASKKPISRETALEMQKDLHALLDTKNFICTGCGYCMPCPQKINIPQVMKDRNYYKVLGMQGALNRLKQEHNWNPDYRIENCVKCGGCESKCPNSVPILSLFDEITELRK